MTSTRPEPSTGADETPRPADAAVAKFMRRVVPVVMAAYVVAYLDRTNIGIARLQMGEALGLGAAAFGLGAGLFFVGYFVFEIPSNYAVRAVGARLWITRIMVTWGLVTMGTALVVGETSFYVARLLLGAAEAGFAPAVLLYFTVWLPRRERAKAFALFGLAIPIATVVGGPLGGLLLTLGGPLQGWQWLFVVEGVLALAMAVVVFRVLPSAPADARWLTGPERDDLADRVEDDRSSSAVEPAKLAGYAVFRRPQLWALMVVLFLAYSGIYAISTFLPSMIAGYGGLGSVAVGVLVAVPSLVAIPVTLWVARSCARHGRLALHLGAIFAAGGAALLLTAVVALPLALFVAAMTVLVSATVAYAAPLFSIATSIIGPRPGPIALFTSIGALGGFFGPTLMGRIVEANGGRFETSALVLALLMLAAAPLGLLGGRGRGVEPARVEGPA